MAYNGFSLLAADNLDRKSSSSSSMIGFRRHDWMRPVCNGVCLVGLAALIALLSFRIDLTPSVVSFLSVPATEVPINENGTAMYIEDVIDMDSDVLVVIRQKYPGSAFPVDDQSLECRYGGFTDRKATSAVQLVNHLLAVLCPAPPEELHWDMNSIVIAVGEEMVYYPEGQQQQPWQWFRPNKVVYEAFPTETDVAVFLRGLDPPSRATKRSAEEEEARLKAIQCVYGERFETAVTAAAQEVIRCAHPPVDLVNEFAGKKVSVKFEGTILPSVAYYNPELHDLPDRIPDRTSLADAPTKHHVCSCTMIHNVAKFLTEWVYYNHHLGVVKFFLYDNGSDDDLDAVIATLGKDGFVIQKQAWPWVKTQNAGFSHCALLAQNECEWMLFTDVDEFFVPGKRFLRHGSQHPDEADVPVGVGSRSTTTTGIISGFEHSSILARVINAATTERGDVGQVSAKCYNFGPSGLTASPPQGVTQGYTCRSRDTERHKSIVLLSSIVDSLENVIHHFSLKQGYRTKMMRPASAVVNHYKFQVWDEFKNKFRRRAATYVADWTEDRNHAAKDRVPDLGIKAIKPADWESRYCEVHDYGLKNYTQRVFGSHDRDNILHLPWA